MRKSIKRWRNGDKKNWLMLSDIDTLQQLNNTFPASGGREYLSRVMRDGHYEGSGPAPSLRHIRYVTHRGEWSYPHYLKLVKLDTIPPIYKDKYTLFWVKYPSRTSQSSFPSSHISFLSILMLKNSVYRQYDVVVALPTTNSPEKRLHHRSQS